MPRIKKKSVQLLIGANIPKAFRVEDVRTAPNTCSPDAVRSPLGWSLLGPSFTDNSFATNVGAYFVAARYESLPTKYISSYEAQFLSENNEYFSKKMMTLIMLWKKFVQLKAFLLKIAKCSILLKNL